MRNITIITGAQMSGKTVKALELALDSKKKYSLVCGQSLYEALKYMNDDTELLIFDDILDFNEISEIMRIDSAIIKKPYKKEPQRIVVPDLIITTSLKGILLFEGVKQYQIINL